MPAAPDADDSPRIRLQCGKCKATGLIAWERLDRLLLCGACQSWWRVETNRLVECEAPRSDQYRVQVRTNSSGWRDHRAIIDRPRRLAVRLRERATEFMSVGSARWVTLLALLGTLGWMMTRAAPSALPPVAVVYPDDLPGRAKMVAIALAERDSQRLAVLTDPTLHRALRVWLGKESSLPPKAERKGTDSAETTAEILEVVEQEKKVRGRKFMLATVKAQIKLPDGEKALLVEHWQENAGIWFFQPPKLRSQLPAENFRKPTRGRR